MTTNLEPLPPAICPRCGTDSNDRHSYECLATRVAELEAERDRLREAGLALLKNGCFTHSDMNITKICCNACGEWVWDDHEAGDIRHHPRCSLALAFAALAPKEEEEP